MKNRLLAVTLSLALPAAAQALPSAPAPVRAISAQAVAMPAVPAAKAGGLPRLTLADAEQMAIRNNPRISVGKLMALVQHQVYREARSAELPTVTGDITGVQAEDATRISAGSLTASRLFSHAGAGANFTQLIYDFGQTHNLVLSREMAEKAANANSVATTEEVVLATDQAFYNALTAQAELQVAQQTVKERQVIDNQVRVMTRNNLKSTLDLSFADVDLSQAKLLQLDAQDNTDSSMANLDALLGLDRDIRYELVEGSKLPPPPPPDASAVVREALRQRPDLQALTWNTKAARKYARSQWDEMLPTISAAGTAGTVPVRPDQYYTANWWGAIGGNVNIPLFNGFLYISRAKAARYQADADAQDARNLRDNIVRDVRTAWLQANTSWQRMAVTAQLVQEADLAFRLARTRYKLGLSSIVELSQAQLQQTSAQIQNASASYQYRLSLATLRYETGVMP
jgi:outer membrane protein